MLHISHHPMCNLPPLKSIQELMQSSTDGWLKVVKIHNNLEYNFTEKTKQEWKYLIYLRQLLEANIPEKYNSGMHLLLPKAGFMGEDICIYEGHLTRTLFLKHKKCKQYKILNWSGSFYCLKCKSLVQINVT